MIATIEEALKAFREGRPVVVVDDEDRENEGDLIFPAQFATPELVNFALKEARGLLCVAITEERARELDLPPMVKENRDPHGTAFTSGAKASIPFRKASKPSLVSG